MGSRFTHCKLDAYNTSLALTVAVERLCASLPRGYADLRDQARRAAAATTRNIAEGANRRLPRDKIARFTIALGEAGECDATLEMIAALGLAPIEHIASLRRQGERVAAMLTGLIRRQEARGGVR